MGKRNSKPIIPRERLMMGPFARGRRGKWNGGPAHRGERAFVVCTSPCVPSQQRTADIGAGIIPLIPDADEPQPQRITKTRQRGITKKAQDRLSSFVDFGFRVFVFLFYGDRPSF